MQAIIFCGIQASGKTSFYRERYFDTHVRISLDVLHTRRRELLILAACIEGRQPFVVDNTNPTVAERARYLAPALAAGFEAIGYFFATEPGAAFERNRRRPGRAAVPAAGLSATYKRLQIPTREEGFHRLYRVGLTAVGDFHVSESHAAAELVNG